MLVTFLVPSKCCPGRECPYRQCSFTRIHHLGHHQFRLHHLRLHHLRLQVRRLIRPHLQLYLRHPSFHLPLLLALPHPIPSPRAHSHFPLDCFPHFHFNSHSNHCHFIDLLPLMPQARTFPLYFPDLNLFKVLGGLATRNAAEISIKNNSSYIISKTSEHCVVKC